MGLRHFMKVASTFKYI